MFKPFWIEWVNWKIVLFDWITANSGEINKWHHVTLLALDVLRWPPVKTGQLALGYKLYCSSCFWFYYPYLVYKSKPCFEHNTPITVHFETLYPWGEKKIYIFDNTDCVSPQSKPNPNQCVVWQRKHSLTLTRSVIFLRAVMRTCPQTHH